MRSGDIGDEAGRSAADAGPLDLDAVRADDDLIEALAAGLVPPPSGPRDTCDVEGELVALLAGWVADVRPETLLHRPAPLTVGVQVAADTVPEIAVGTTTDADADSAPFAPLGSGSPSLLEHDELTRPIALAGWRSSAARPYLLRAAAALVAVALLGSGVVARSYDAHPGEPLWVVAQMVFPAKSHSVEAAISVSTALNTARVALERGRIDEARVAFQTVAAQLADVDEADGRTELNHQMDYVNAQLSTAPAATDARAAAPSETEHPLATGTAGAVIPSSPAVTPGATAALATTMPAPPPSVLAAAAQAAPEGTPAGSPAAPDGTAPAPAAVAAPAPSVDTVSPAPVVSEPPVDPQPSSPPPAVTDPGSTTVSTTTEQAAPPTTDPPTSVPATPTDTQAPVVDTGTPGAGSGYPASGGDPAATTPDSTTTGAQNSAATPSTAAGTTADASVSIDTNGTVGSTLGQVTGVVTNTASS